MLFSCKILIGSSFMKKIFLGQEEIFRYVSQLVSPNYNGVEIVQRVLDFMQEQVAGELAGS